VPAFVDANIVSALVAILRHESPYCIAAAAGALALLAHHQEGWKPLMKASAVPALVRVVERQLPYGDFMTWGASLSWRCEHSSIYAYGPSSHITMTLLSMCTGTYIFVSLYALVLSMVHVAVYAAILLTPDDMSACLVCCVCVLVHVHHLYTLLELSGMPVGLCPPFLNAVFSSL
jgi:hypothetical protein